MPRRPRVLAPTDPDPEPEDRAPILRNDPIPDAALNLEPEDWVRRLEHIYGGVASDLKVLMERFERFEKGWPLEPARTADGEPAGLDRWNDDVAGRVTDLRKDFQEVMKKADALHTLEKDPVLKAGRAVDGYHNKFAERIGLFDQKKKLILSPGVNAPLNVLSRRLNIYLLHQEAIRRRKAQAEADEARRVADEAIRRASQTMKPEALDDAADAAGRAAETQEMATAPPADLSRVRGEGGAVASLRGRWAFVPEESDLMALVKAIAAGKAPLHFVQFAETRIGFEIRSGEPPLRECPGMVIKQILKA